MKPAVNGDDVSHARLPLTPTDIRGLRPGGLKGVRPCICATGTRRTDTFRLHPTTPGATIYYTKDGNPPTTGFLNETTSYAYDLAGNITAMTDPKGAIYNFDYDLLNRKILMTPPADASGIIRPLRWTYDDAGNLATANTPAGFIKTFTSDNRNRPTTAAWNTTYGGTVGSTAAYDAASRVTSIVSGNTTVAFGYDNANRKIWEDQTLAGLPTRHIVTAVNAEGNRSSLVLAGVYALSYDYTRRQQLSRISIGGTDWFTFTYDENGNLTKRQNVNQGMDATIFAYDELNRPTLCQQTGANDVPFATSHYAYDLLGRLQYTYREE